MELGDLPFQSPSLVDSLADALRQAILGGKLAGGDAIRQGQIAENFGVSRIPVREALLKLEGEGLVEAVPRRGFVVTTLSARDFKEILEMRFALESLAIELAAARFSPVDLHEALELVDAATAAMPAEGNEDLREEFESRWGSLNWTFHRRLYVVAQRPRLLSWIENLQHLFARQLRGQIDLDQKSASKSRKGGSGRLRANRQEWERVLEEHRQMAMACGRHDAEAARTILKAHVFDHGEKLVQQIYG